MKSVLLLVAMLFLITACASTNDGGSFEPQMKYGGSYRVRGAISNNVHDGTQK